MSQCFKAKILFWAVLIMVIGTSYVFAGGLTNSSIGLRGIAMAGTPVSNVNDASAIYYNPAALALYEPNAQFAEIYGYTTIVDHVYKADGIKDESNQVYVVPGSFFSSTKSGWGWGIGAYVPFAGGGMKFEDARNIPGADYEFSAGYMAITTSFGYKINPKVSMGAGFTIFTGQMLADQPGYKAEWEDKTAGYSGNIGLMYSPTDKSRFGLNFRLPTSMEMDGEVKYLLGGNWIKMDSTVKFTAPWIVDAGYTYFFSDAFMLSTRFSYYAYGDMEEYTYKMGSIETDRPTDYDDSWAFAVGGEYLINTDYSFRFGSNYATYARKKSGLKESTQIDPNVLTINCGIGYNWSQKVELSMSYMHGFGFERENENKKFDQDNDIIALGAIFKF